MTVSNSTNSPASASDATKPSNFLRQIIESDLASGKHSQIVTRFPPEPNGYLHIGHAKSICLNFGLARDYKGICNLRFDDTNPEKEEKEYVDSIIDSVKWLGFSWGKDAGKSGHESALFASNYFDFMYKAAEHLIERGLAYVDEQSAEDMRANRGDFNTPGKPSPYRALSAEHHLNRFREMRDGKHADGAMVLRAKIDLASPNINLRDPAIYRIRRATHHNTGDTWCIYPMYTYAHPIEDALEGITHSICTLEFEDQRPFYDWLMDRLLEGGLIKQQPRQYEFARLNLTYVITSKRKLAQLVNEKKVSGWDDPRMPTIVGLRRRGYTPESLQLFAERIGVSKSDSWIDYSTLEGCLRETLDPTAPRAMAVLEPLKLVLTNWEEAFGSAAHLEDCSAPVHPHLPDLGKRNFKLGKEVWIEQTDYEEIPSKGFFRLFPGNKVRLKYGYVIEVEGADYAEGTDEAAIKSGAARAVSIRAKVLKDTKSGTPGSDAIKVKGVITWVGAADAVTAEIRLYDRLFKTEHPDAGGKDFLEALNEDSLKTIQAYVEPSLANAKPDEKFQFERHGYFVADRKDHAAGEAVFNKITGLKDTWAK
ncbi:glutamine--tRNA ligase/YqeY domain fusion protein [Variovorax sp. PCZ-1]|uniref:glutamine--tRNA ligase/YqeY domain fusion protein n=1 Tax=Variovorax sp. PCZ-1 TaxID=2835533 RepID=UPI001BCDCF4A|nr:glutamine--tRNA ligase/YqeY domain fusion protein [Variovorax sp. PCZ-1]MBS7807157.1 glutamine--tRNA ligase/YqeY domain fusion protein [Variovorax sp. PCZ-1]